MRSLLTIAVFLASLLPVAVQANHHSWRVVEVFSNDDGTLQFIQMSSSKPDETQLSCCVFSSRNTSTGESVSYSFPDNLSQDSLDRELLLGTAGIEAAWGIRPDYIIPDNFVFTTTGGIQYNEPVVWDSLPTNGVDSLNIDLANGEQFVAAATPANFAGITLTLPVDLTPPVLTLPGPLTIESNVAVTSDDGRVTGHFDAIACTDDSGDEPVVDFELPVSFEPGTTSVAVTCTDNAGNDASGSVKVTVQSFPDADNDGIKDADDPDDDNDGVNDVDDAFPFDPAESIDTDGDGVGDNADDDDDGDGVPDDADAFPLDPNETKDTDGDGIGDHADTDDDGNGIPDAEEDNVPPLITGTTEITIDATGRLTTLALSGVTATDDKDGPVDATPDKKGPFESGRHAITWTASDNAGNTATAEQIVNIRPLVSFQLDQTLAEGASTSATAQLSGNALSYPLSIPLTVTGTTDDRDTAALPSVITIESGTAGSIGISATDDGVAETDETLILTLQPSDAYALGPRVSHTVTITERNLPPRAELLINQAGEPRAFVYADGGAVVIEATASDPNPGTSLSYDWSGSSPEILTNGVTDPKVSFDASMLASGTYRIEVIVSDGALATRRERTLIVLPQTPALDASDTDGDGTSDIDEGLADDDQDGIPNWLDINADSSRLPSGEGDLMDAEQPLQLRLGETALTIQSSGAAIASDAVEDPDAGYRHIGALYDFVITGLDADGTIATVVIPLSEAIPAGAVWRKFFTPAGWADFTSDNANTIASASGRAGVCPWPHDAAWQEGLTAGHYCVQLTIEDGGANDGDGSVNSQIRDPGGLAVPDAVPVLAAPAPLTLEATNADGISADDDAIDAFIESATCTDTVDGTLEVATTTPLAFPLGTTDVTFSCTDSAANTVTASVAVQVEDTTPPAISLGAPLELVAADTVNASDPRITAFLDAIRCTDAVSGDLAVSSSLPSTLNQGTTPVTLACEDEAGNTQTAETSITVSMAAAHVQNDDGTGCFIATAAYGSALDPHVESLRGFRDRALIGHPAGDWLVETYYRHSPALAEVIANHPWLRALTRALLLPLVFAIVQPGYALLILCMTWLWLRRRRAGGLACQ